MSELKKLDAYSEEYKKAKLEDLIADAVARKDKKAFDWLNVESAKKENRTRNGVTNKVSKNIATIRADYAKKFLGYKPTKVSAETLRKRKQEKAEKERQEMFAKYAEMFEEK